MPRLFSFGGRGGRLGGVQQEQLKGEPSCLRHQAAGTRADLEASDMARWASTKRGMICSSRVLTSRMTRSSGRAAPEAGRGARVASTGVDGACQVASCQQSAPTDGPEDSSTDRFLFSGACRSIHGLLENIERWLRGWACGSCRGSIVGEGDFATPDQLPVSAPAGLVPPCGRGVKPAQAPGCPWEGRLGSAGRRSGIASAPITSA